MIVTGGRRTRFPSWRRALVGLAMVISMAMPVPPAAARTPLLMAGKQTLYQRVLVRPEARLHAAPGKPAAAEKGLRAFDILYVFGEQTVAGEDWVEVGRSVAEPTLGWLAKDATAEWKQTVVVSFSNRGGRERSLLFDQPETLKALLDRDDRASRLALLRDEATGGGAPGVVSIEPEEPVDIQDQFYLLPILDHARFVSDADFSEVTALKVASVPDETPVTPTVPVQPDYTLGVVFVIDTTITMAPYIERTRAAIERFYDQFASSPQADKVSYGLIGFRNSLKRAPRVEYLTRTYLELTPGQRADQVMAALSRVEEARASTGRQLEEDVYAGIVKAIDGVDWEPFAGRLVVLVTDTGPLLPTDALRSVDLEASTLNELARSKDIALHTLFLEPPADKLRRPAYQEMMAQALPELQLLSAGYASEKASRLSVIEESSEERFADAVQQLIEVVQASVTDNVEEQKTKLEQERDEAARHLRLDTLAMRLAYLGRREGTRAPSVIEGWIADRALDDPSKVAVEVHMLMTKDQLSTLRDVVARILAAGYAAQLDSPTFFGRVRDALATMAREPGKLVASEFGTLGTAAAEYIEGLPYESEALKIDEQRWVEMSPTDQRELLARLETKLKLFDRFHDDPALWTALYDGAPPGETVFPMPLSALP